MRQTIESEHSRSSFLICCGCKYRHIMEINDQGWWKPICEYWNVNKSTPSKPYGPKEDCPYILEQTVLDTGRNFKLDAEKFKELFEFCEKKGIVIKTKPHSLLLGMYDKKAVLSPALSFNYDNVLEWINETLIRMEARKLDHKKYYKELVRSKGDLVIREIKKEVNEKKVLDNGNQSRKTEKAIRRARKEAAKN